MSLLFSPLQLGPLSLPNRIVIAPMCQYSADEGRASDWHAQHLGMLAQSGAGLLILEATAVEPRGRISWADLGLWDEATETALGDVLASLRRWSKMPIGIQLAHAGRKASSARPWDGDGVIAPGQPNGWQTLAPSALPFAADGPLPHALDEAGIDAVVAAFAGSALRAARLGMDLIEIHAAHGYLLHQFLSPLSNRRDDAYGGTLENRMRLTLRVFDAVRAAVPANIAVGVRISAADWVDGGWDIEQSIVLAKALEARGSDFIHVSSGGLSLEQKIPVGPGYQLPFARQVKEASGLPTIGVGLITEAKQAEAVVTEGDADLVAVARAMLYDPRWPWHAAAELGAQVQAPPQFWRGAPRGAEGVFSPLP